MDVPTDGWTAGTRRQILNLYWAASRTIAYLYYKTAINSGIHYHKLDRHRVVHLFAVGTGIQGHWSRDDPNRCAASAAVTSAASAAVTSPAAAAAAVAVAALRESRLPSYSPSAGTANNTALHIVRERSRCVPSIETRLPTYASWLIRVHPFWFRAGRCADDDEKQNDDDDDDDDNDDNDDDDGGRSVGVDYVDANGSVSSSVGGCLQWGSRFARRRAIKCAPTRKLTCSRLAFIETPCARS
ncbi:hypothetical protein HZH68_016038 [Vespula germanica]|uniref:Uncharacterized protein n=1 Tax=Vespula germanica TaxID=30212 RepID=A0A834J360_VESGE|nr:hypothetical protein HZH68_016038 [Vespula germanica]